MNFTQSKDQSECPVCYKSFSNNVIENHVMQCIDQASSKTKKVQENQNNFEIFSQKPAKKAKLEISIAPRALKPMQSSQHFPTTSKLKEDAESKRQSSNKQELVPLAEKIRPSEFDDYVGQTKLVGEGSVLRNLLEKNVIPSMILWGAPGCGKTTLAHIISNYCSKNKESMRFVKLSATTSGINDVKEVVKQAKNFLDLSKRRTILFMDEIHRFNKLQQVPSTLLEHFKPILKQNFLGCFSSSH